MRAHLKALPLALIALTFGCSQSPTRITDTHRTETPLGGPAIELSVTAAPAVGGPEQPVSLELSATNASGTEIWRCEGCGCGNGIKLTVLGPDGSPVALTDPLATAALCPDTMVPWAPAGSVERNLQFTGVLYRKDAAEFPSPFYGAPSGTYTVVATFSYANGPNGAGGVEVERTATFVWTNVVDPK